MTAPTVLVLDLGGVTCRWDPDRRLAGLSALSGLPVEMVDQLIFESGFDDASDRGAFTLGEFVEHVSTVLGLPMTPDDEDALRSTWASAYEPDRGVLRIVHAAPLATALFTNNGPLMEAAIEAELSEVGDAFDHLVFAWRLGASKPSPEAYAKVTEILGVRPDQVFFADDSQANVDGALAFGWQAHRFTTALDLQAALAAALA